MLSSSTVRYDVPRALRLAVLPVWLQIHFQIQSYSEGRPVVQLCAKLKISFSALKPQ